ncbi:MAG: DUF1080 domain-containing protein [Verrucomicrobia bacterium]|nr:DUF1080 domain-containing protein [Verrucomicrobiota bacterium]
MNHPFPSAAKIRSMLMLGLLPFALASLVSAADDLQPPVVDPCKPGGPPSDAIVLFDGKDLSKFRGKNSDMPNWKLENGVMETIPGGDANGMFSREEFGDCQARVEWASPAVPEGDDQSRGNSGVFLMGRYRCVWVRKLNL